MGNANLIAPILAFDYCFKIKNTKMVERHVTVLKNTKIVEIKTSPF